MSESSETPQETVAKENTTLVEENSPTEAQASSTENSNQHTGSQEEESGEKLQLVEQAVYEAGEKISRLLHMSREAMDRGASTESFCTTDEEWQRMANRTTQLVQLMHESNSNEEKISAVREFINWYSEFKPIIQHRVQSKSNYFDGNFPEGLAVQHRLFDAVGNDVENMMHYLALAEN